jgi:hypothetical protein
MEFGRTELRLRLAHFVTPECWPEGPATGQLTKVYLWFSVVVDQTLLVHKLHVALHASHCSPSNINFKISPQTQPSKVTKMSRYSLTGIKVT